MKNDIYFDGTYYDSEKLTDLEKKEIEKTSPKFYSVLVKRYSYKVSTKTKKVKQDGNLEMERSANNQTD